MLTEAEKNAILASSNEKIREKMRELWNDRHYDPTNEKYMLWHFLCDVLEKRDALPAKTSWLEKPP